MIDTLILFHTILILFLYGFSAVFIRFRRCFSLAVSLLFSCDFNTVFTWFQCRLMRFWCCFYVVLTLFHCGFDIVFMRFEHFFYGVSTCSLNVIFTWFRYCSHANFSFFFLTLFRCNFLSVYTQNLQLSFPIWTSYIGRTVDLFLSLSYQCSPLSQEPLNF